MRDWTKIVAWQKADDLAIEVYRLTQAFPKEELYGITGQTRRAICSVPSNIVEGASRNTQKDYLHFLYIARGSLNEARYFLHLACRLGYLTAQAQQTVEQLAGEVSRTLTGLIRAVEKESEL
jgi:four helix bundle protein